MAERNDPYRNFRFVVSLGNIKVAGFTEVTLPDAKTNTVDYREGTDAPNLTYKLSGLTKYGDLTLKNGITQSLALYQWKRQVELKGAKAQRQNIGISLVDEEGQETAKWDVQNAWPTSYEASGLNAEGNEVVIQTIVIAHEGIERKK